MRHSESVYRLKKLFREQFRVDTADLNFGPYHPFHPVMGGEL
jgi:hypothetical protein